MPTVARRTAAQLDAALHSARALRGLANPDGTRSLRPAELAAIRAARPLSDSATGGQVVPLFEATPWAGLTAPAACPGVRDARTAAAADAILGPIIGRLERPRRK
jgi:hypothetical protein